MDRIEAKISRSWAIRMTIAGIAFAGFGIMSLYDGKVRYPRVNQDFRTFLARHAGEDPETMRTVYQPEEFEMLREKFMGASERWNSYWKQERKGWLARRGWKDMDQTKLFSRERPDVVGGIPGNIHLTDYIHSEWDLRTQLIMAAACLPIGFIILFRLIRNLSKVAWSDGETLHTLKGREVPFSAITHIDKKKWDRKAIAYVHYDIDGNTGKALLDDWIFKGSAEILDQIESVLNPPEQVEENQSEEAAAPEGVPDRGNEAEDGTAGDREEENESTVGKQDI